MISAVVAKMISESLKERNEVRLSTLRMLLNSLNYEKISKRRELSEDEELMIVRREIKKRLEAIRLYRNATGAAKDKAELLANKEEQEIEILKEFLPDEMPEEELAKVIDRVVGGFGELTMRDMGRIVSAVKQEVKAADGATIARLVREKILSIQDKK
jgi:hypothetical protein